MAERVDGGAANRQRFSPRAWSIRWLPARQDGEIRVGWLAPATVAEKRLRDRLQAVERATLSRDRVDPPRDEA